MGMSMCARILGVVLFSATAFAESETRNAKETSARATASVPGTVYGLFCRVTDNEWRRVLSYDANGIMLHSKRLTFEKLWSNPSDLPSVTSGAETISWSAPLAAVPDENITCWAYALTYHEHRREARLDKSFKFPKGGPAFPTSQPIAYRDNLDYEAEIGVLMQRGRTDQFGYVLVNDLTDRGIQVREYDEKNPVPSFSHSKTFPESLRVGPLLAIGDANAWKLLRVTLDVNGKRRQDIRAADCVYDPSRFHEEIFAEASSPEWVLVASGTGGGVIFRQPSLPGKIWLFIRSGFSVARAKEKFLKQLGFLKPDVTLVLSSPTLGYSKTEIVNSSAP
jgi:2-keto-4-pentenoate hydratase/2-oxohepta-3-ene-1,7-dioic acid hydratase in catechol pathway